jgi:DNA-binding transcriptional ArsR family regulator
MPVIGPCRKTQFILPIDLPSATLSFHLKVLRSAGLVACERDGRSRIYSPELSTVNALIDFLTANCCRGLDDSGSVTEDCEPRTQIDC